MKQGRLIVISQESFRSDLMLKFLFDCGNTCIKFALYDKNSVLTAHRFVEYAELETFIQKLFDHYPLPDEIRIASVTRKERLDKLHQLIAKYLNKTPIVAKSQRKSHGLLNQYDVPDKLGVDRWLAMLAAKAQYPQNPLLVVDLGTALTIDHITQEGFFQGGVILPGMKSMKDALLKDTTLHVPDDLPYQNELGKNTSNCISAGIYYALVGAISSIYHALGDNALVVLSGGRAEWLAEILEKEFPSLSIKVHKHLVLEGLLIFDPVDQ